MAWSTPITWLANQIVTAAQMNASVSDNLVDLDTRVKNSQQFVQEDITMGADGLLPVTPGTTVVALNASIGDLEVTGIAAPSPVRPLAIEIVSVYTGNITIKHDSSATVAGNRFFLPGVGDLVLSQGGGVRFLYVSVPVGARWVSMIGS